MSDGTPVDDGVVFPNEAPARPAKPLTWSDVDQIELFFRDRPAVQEPAALRAVVWGVSEFLSPKL